ncbi:MAG: hypothetical protein ABI615_07380, partial [Chthoniobacterales bacterium]
MSIPLSFNQPYALTALIGLVLLWHWQKRTLVNLTPARRRNSFFLRMGGFAFLIFALSNPLWIQDRRQTSVAWLIDRSRSMGDEATKAATPFFEATQKLGQMKSWILTPFAGNAAILPSMKDSEKLN